MLHRSRPQRGTSPHGAAVRSASRSAARRALRLAPRRAPLPRTPLPAPLHPLQLVVGDALRLRQVVLNLLSNAIKFTKEGTIWVRCWLEDDTEEAHTVRFEV